MMGANHDRSLRLQGAARVLALLARHHHQTDTASTIMETLGITADGLEKACDPKSFAERARGTDRL